MRFSHLFPNSWGDGFLQVEASKDVAMLSFDDMHLPDENAFFSFCEQLVLYSGLKDLKITNILLLSQHLNSTTSSEKFYNVVKNLKYLENFTVRNCNLFLLSSDVLKNFLQQLVEFGIMHIDLRDNQFTVEQIQIIRKFEKEYVDEILINLNLPNILNQFKLSDDIKENYIVPFVQKKCILKHVDGILNARSMQRSLAISNN